MQTEKTPSIAGDTVAASQWPADASLLASDITLAQLLDPAYWEAAVPFLHCRRDTNAENSAAALAAALLVTPAFPPVPAPAPSPLLLPHCTSAFDAAAAAAGGGSAALHAALITRGYFRLSAADLEGIIPPGLPALLDRGIMRLRQLGHAPSAIAIFDEAWQLAHAVSGLCASATGNAPHLGDWMAFCVTPSSHAFAGPHRDKPNAGDESFAADGAPLYETVWISLSEATPENSCLYFLAADRDAGYRAAGDALVAALPSPASWPDITAQPCSAGGVLCFSHRLLHWGSTPTSGAASTHRTALSFAMAAPSFVAPYFDAALYAPYPPLGLRVSLRAGQAIVYHSQAPVTKNQLALDRRTFARGRDFFSEEYAERVLSDAQMIFFMGAHLPPAKKSAAAAYVSGHA